ncbi:TPA: hypothetical protein DEO28_04775 [Candidatus Dependentiae bacterium]|nr:MAG: hypothetical protein UR14_C0002G0069 [candidate division TM6 bacterium GW2011_GWE2_31_21]KKP53866.1 MAG: hypothetical protein UR43_C0002G0069 [candidate division TM6 bacterium GW2011_GWF2_33_332]HBS47646.1 hypothetical protein [Candidatus Dependentiae bacterium]HBZ73795.1 hypothetical protein [Candidatus Dependentiae bacterium]
MVKRISTSFFLFFLFFAATQSVNAGRLRDILLSISIESHADVPALYEEFKRLINETNVREINEDEYPLDCAIRVHLHNREKDPQNDEMKPFISLLRMYNGDISFKPCYYLQHPRTPAERDLSAFVLRPRQSFFPPIPRNTLRDILSGLCMGTHENAEELHAKFKQLIESGANANETKMIQHYGSDKEEPETVLDYAMMIYSHNCGECGFDGITFNCIKLLLEHGAKVKAEDVQYYLNNPRDDGDRKLGDLLREVIATQSSSNPQRS